MPKKCEQSVQFDGLEMDAACENRVQELKKQMTDLCAQADFYQTIADCAHDWVYWVSPEHVFLYVSPACERITGYPPQAFLDDPELLPRIIAPQDLPLFQAHVAKLTQTPRKERPLLEFRILTASGETRWISHSCQPVYGRNGEFLGVRGSNRDVTESKAVEARLLLHVEELEALHELSRATAKSLSLEDVVQASLDLINKLFCPDMVVLFMLQDGKLTLKGITSTEPALHSPSDAHPVGECLCGLAAHQSEPVFSSNIQEDTRCTRTECKKAGLQSFASMPLINRDRTIGVLAMGSKTRRDFSTRETFFQSLAAVVSMGAANAQLYQQQLDHADNLEALVEKRTAELKKFHNAVEHSPASIVITDTQGVIEYVNPFFSYTTGYNREEILGEKPRILQSGVHDQAFYAEMWRTLEARRIWRGEFCNRKKDGTLFWENASISPLLNERGVTVSYVAVKEDITERKKAETALRESELRYKTVFESSQDGILIADLETMRLVHANDAICRLLGYSREKLLAMDLRDLHPMKDLPMVMAKFEKQISGNKPLAHEIPCLTSQAEVIYCDVNASRVTIENRTRLIGFFRDVTERREAAKLRDDIEQLLRHDLKGPLNGVINLPEVLLDAGDLTPEQEDMLESIRESGRLVLDMVNKSLDLYKMETGAYRYRPSPMDLARTLRRLAAGLRPKASRLGVRLIGTLEGQPLEDAGAITIQAEELLLYSLLSNLAANAVEASPIGGQVTLQASAEGGLHISIHNDSPVPKAIRKRFFEKYATHGKKYGTGLGAYSARLMARTMGGDIEMETSQAHGTTLRVHIPAPEDEPPAPVEEPGR
jgi:PAS domain S-box-containing protein